MKTKLIYFAVILLTLQINAQEAETYKSFLHSGVVKWLYFVPTDACGLYEISAYGDTIINQFEYKKLWSSFNYGSYQNDSNLNQQWLTNNNLFTEKNMFLRQSSDSSKLYLFDASENVEYLIADMSLKVGDEFNFPGIGNQVVESVNYDKGLKIIHFRKNHSLYAGELIFVESIGPNVNFIFADENDDSNYNLLGSIMLCYSRYSYLYVKPTYICGCLANKAQEVAKSQLHYRLVDNNIEIKLNELSSKYWEMFDFSGKVVRRSGLTNESLLRISTTGLNRGIYLLRLYDMEKDKSYTLKVLL
jgi:hypothetical protein